MANGQTINHDISSHRLAASLRPQDNQTKRRPSGAVRLVCAFGPDFNTRLVAANSRPLCATKSCLSLNRAISGPIRLLNLVLVLVVQICACSSRGHKGGRAGGAHWSARIHARTHTHTHTHTGATKTTSKPKAWKPRWHVLCARNQPTGAARQRPSCASLSQSCQLELGALRREGRCERLAAASEADAVSWRDGGAQRGNGGGGGGPTCCCCCWLAHWPARSLRVTVPPMHLLAYGLAAG